MAHRAGFGSGVEGDTQQRLFALAHVLRNDLVDADDHVLVAGLLAQEPADGKVMYQVCGQDIPMSADALDQAIRSELFRRRRCCPQPQPQPQPEPQPQPDPAPQPLDHVGPPDVAPEPKSGLPPWWALVGLGVLGAGAGVVAKWKETYYPSTKK